MSDREQTTPSEQTEITDRMWLAGLEAARRAGIGPAKTYDEFYRFKAALIAAYHAMRAEECADGK
jgi:hypothetical protein